MTYNDGPRWTKDDLDRCEHGRHSIDPCFGCPDGQSEGNKFLLTRDSSERIRIEDGNVEVRIGTTIYGMPIWVVAKAKGRQVT